MRPKDSIFRGWAGKKIQNVVCWKICSALGCGVL